MTDKEHSRVHFCEEVDTFGKDNDILVQRTSDDTFSVHLGFLKIHHRYKIEFVIPSSVWNINNSSSEVKEISNSLVPQINCKLLSSSIHLKNCHLVVELFTYKEKLMKEELFLKSSTCENPIKVILMARILGKNKGTPLLKNGITCIGIEEEDESEASDWQGFD